jgi:hypothetical protein
MGYSRLPVNPKYDWMLLYNNVNSLDQIANKEIRPILDKLQKSINDQNMLRNELRYLEDDNSSEADALILRISDAENVIAQLGASFKKEYDRTVRVKKCILPNVGVMPLRDIGLQARWTGD